MRDLSCIRRATSLLLACWLAVFIAQPAAMHACPVHTVSQEASHASHHGSHPQDHHKCTCPGDCCCPCAGAQLAPTPTTVPARIVSFVEPDIAIPGLVRSADVQFLLPPSVGPPTISG